MKWMHALRGAMALAVAMFGAFALADIDVPSDGSDGDLVVAVDETRTIDLGLATTGSWNQPGNGNGVYDPVKWAVVFKYNSVNIGNRGFVRFINHPSNPPVVWLVKGDVFCQGYIILEGQAGRGDRSFSIPGPGGFGGNRGTSTNVDFSAGRGPGAAAIRQEAAAHSNSNGNASAYGNAALLPLIGGSGGVQNSSAGGGAGGGAILIAARRTINIIKSPSFSDGGVMAGSTGRIGSGGGIRLVAETIRGDGRFNVTWTQNTGFTEAFGRIRIEAVNNFSSYTLQGSSSVVPLLGAPQIWPSDTSPQTKILSIGGLTAPSDPRAQDGAANADMALNTDQPVIVRVQCTNVPIANWKVQLKLVVPEGDAVLKECTLIEGNDVVSFWEASFTLPPGVSVIQPRAYKFQ